MGGSDQSSFNCFSYRYQPLMLNMSDALNVCV